MGRTAGDQTSSLESRLQMSNESMMPDDEEATVLLKTTTTTMTTTTMTMTMTMMMMTTMQSESI